VSSRCAGVVLVLMVAAIARVGVGDGAVAPLRVWPGETIGYRDLTGGNGYHAAVREAVAAWNRVGLGVRFVPAPRGRSAVQVAYVPGSCLSGSAGRAPTGFQRFGARVVVRSCPAILRPLLVAHELGRVLGLSSDDHTCSLMNSKGASDGRTFAAPAGCSRAVPPAWLPQLIDPLTVARAHALYAAPPAAVDVRFTAGPQPRLDWRLPRTSGGRTLVLRTTGRCPVRADVPGATGATVVYSKPSYAGLHYAVDSSLGSTPGRYCYRLFNVSVTGRPTPSPSFGFDFQPGPIAVAAIATSPVVAGAPVTFTDRSTDAGGEIVQWHWDFGDPASGTADVVDTADPTLGRAPAHTYTAGGSYTVTLTVTDSLGRSAAATIGVTVQQ
jgi:hypothetical protein